jgi:HAD superfamily hydrolase (TIGR01509 family)
MIFDLDGTLVQTERLKAVSYAQAARELSRHTIAEDAVMEAFKDVVGLSRQEVATQLLERFGLEAAARSRMAEFGVDAPWQAFARVRLGIYERMLEDPEILRKSQWPHAVALVKEARGQFCKLALATMSARTEALRVLTILCMHDVFDFVATRDDVERGKPDPEIYSRIARELLVSPGDCLVIEDSPSGVKAARSAGMWCIAVSTPFTREKLHAGKVLEERWIVDDPTRLLARVQAMISERK